VPRAGDRSDNFFAEIEQVAFHTVNVVPGIDFTNDPLLQVRNFSYLDTQLIRLGGPNFAQLPVNRPIAEVSTNQRDGYHQSRVHRGRTAYVKNTLGGGCPAIADVGLFKHYQEKVDGHKIRKRAASFQDYYSQANTATDSIRPRKVAVLVTDGVEAGPVNAPAERCASAARSRNCWPRPTVRSAAPQGRNWPSTGP
jgi:catalase